MTTNSTPTGTAPTLTPTDARSLPARPGIHRRSWLLAAAVPAGWVASLAQATTLPEAMRRARALRDEAVRMGDQPYGAVVLRGAEIVGAAPSRVVIANDPTAHAEREALRDAARRLGTRDLSGAVLVSTSRPCPTCEAAAAAAGIVRMVHGEALTDAGPPVASSSARPSASRAAAAPAPAPAPASQVPAARVPAEQMSEALVSAAQAGDLAAVRRMLDAGAPVDARDARRRTALLAATHANRVDVARLLIERGADVNAADDIQDSPFLYAGAEGRLEILRLTLAAGADLKSTNRYGGTALIPAAHHGHVETVRELLKTAIDVDHVNRLGWTALLEAIILGDGGAAHTTIVRLLVAAGANVNLADAQGVSPLVHAQQRGQQAIVALLRGAGAAQRAVPR